MFIWLCTNSYRGESVYTKSKEQLVYGPHAGMQKTYRKCSGHASWRHLLDADLNGVLAAPRKHHVRVRHSGSLVDLIECDDTTCRHSRMGYWRESCSVHVRVYFDPSLDWAGSSCNHGNARYNSRN